MLEIQAFTFALKQQADGPLNGGKLPTGPYSRTYRILEDLYESSPVLYCTVNENGVVLDCNKTYAKRMGYSKAESVGKPVFDHVGPNSLVAMHEYLEIWQKIGLVENLEVWLRRKDGDVFPALLSAASVHNEHGDVVACNISLIDQTDIYKTKKDVERANEELKIKEQLKNEFIAIASHELRTPIQPLLGYAILAKKGKISQEAAWEGILREARRLQQLANDILDVSRIESGSLMYQMEKVPISSLLESVTGSAGANPAEVSMELVIDEASRDLEVELDRSRMTQVLSNVIGNAVKFTEKGRIRIECKAFMSKNKVEIKVSDTGAGIPEQVMPNLFGKFVTKSAGQAANGHGGTGLGLFISKAIVNAHKGEIYAYNNATGGATFTIILPVNQSNIIYD